MTVQPWMDICTFFNNINQCIFQIFIFFGAENALKTDPKVEEIFKQIQIPLMKYFYFATSHLSKSNI